MKKLHVNLMIVEDDILVCKNMKKYCERFFPKIFIAHDADSAFEIYLDKKPGVMLCDIELPGMNGLELISKIRKIDERCLIFLASAFQKDNYLLEAIPLKLEGFMLKPLSSSKMNYFLEKCEQKLSLPDFFVSAGGVWSYSYTKKSLLYKNEAIDLTHYEISIFEALLKHRNNYLLYENIESDLEGEISKGSLRTIISRIRKKAPFLSVSSKQNIGYRLDVDN